MRLWAYGVRDASCTNSILNHGKAHFENALKPAIFKISFSMFRIGIGIERRKTAPQIRRQKDAKQALRNSGK